MANIGRIILADNVKSTKRHLERLVSGVQPGMIFYHHYAFNQTYISMNFVTDRIQRIISGNPTPTQRKTHPFDFIQTRKGILRELMISKESGNLIGLVSPALGEGIFLVQVLYVELQNAEEVIGFQKYDVSDGRTSLIRSLTIRDIKGVCPFIHSKQMKTSVV